MHRFVASFSPNTASPIRPAVNPATAPEAKKRRARIPYSMFAAVRHAAVAIRAGALALLVTMALPLAAQAADTQAPSVPAGLTATTISASQINLTWTAATDNVGVKGYQVFLNNVVVSTTSSTSFQHTGLAAGTTYNYRVNAFDAANNYSGWTPTAVVAKTTAVADTSPPSVPTGLTGTAVSNTQINLTWTASTDNVGVKGYYVYLNDVALAVTTTPSYKHTGLIAGTTYNYRVSAYDAVPNHSAWTAPVAVKTTGTAPADTTPPSVPSGLAGTAVSNTQINLTWTAATDNVGVKGYQVFVNNVVVSTTSSTSFQHTGLAAGTTYNYRVNAFDAANNYSGWTPTAVAVKTTLVAPLDTTPPSIPAGLTGTAASSTQINLTWTAATDNVGVKGYQVFLNDAMIATTSTPSFQHTGLAAATTYNYRVNAFDAANNYSGWTVTPVAVKTTGTTATTPAAGALWSCAFPSSPTNCGFQEQSKVAGRGSVVNFGRDDGTALRLHTEPGDNNVENSGTMERDDVWLSQDASNGYAGQEAWWAHSILFPDDFTMPTWQMYVVADFHNTSTGSWQANINLDFEPQADTTKPGNLTLRGYGGTNSGDGAYKATIGPVTKNVWYDFVYHVKWSSGSDGYFDAWVNGVKVLSHTGPTLYSGQGIYLKLANYHTPVCDPYPACLGTQLASSVIHDRVIRGSTALSVSSGPLEGVLVLTNGVLTAVAP